MNYIYSGIYTTLSIQVLKSENMIKPLVLQKPGDDRPEQVSYKCDVALELYCMYIAS